MLTFAAGSLLTLLQFLLVLYSSTAWTLRVIPRQAPHIKLTVISIGMWWIPAIIFAILIPIGLFDRLTTTAFLTLFTILSAHSKTHALNILRFWNTSLHAPIHLWRTVFPLWLKVAAGGLGAVFLTRLARGTIAPPLAWDALTYHLLKAGRWVQTGGWVHDTAPDSWQIYEWFPPLGDVYFAWAMLGSHSDAWLTWLGGLIWINCLLAVYALARSFQFDQKLASIATITVASVPALLVFISASYVDNTAFAIVTLGTTLLISGSQKRDPILLLIGSTAMALAVGIKITFLPYLLVALTLFAWHLFQQRQWRLIPAALLLILPCLAWQFWLIALGKTPFFPAPFSIIGIQVESGLPEFLEHLYTSMDLAYVYEMPVSVSNFLINNRSHSPGHYNFTWTFPVILFLGLLGSYVCVKETPWRTKFAFAGIFLAGMAIFVSFWSPQTSYYRAVWVENMGRFYSTWYAVLVISTLYLWNRTWTYLFAILIAVNLYESWPKAWVMLDYNAVALGTAITASLIAAVLATWKLKRPVLQVAITVLGLAILLPSVYYLRSTYRYVFYSAGNVHDIYYPGTISRLVKAAKYTDQFTDKTIAFSRAYEEISYRWFRYIFLGSRLQNHIVYIPPTSSGETWSESTNPSPPEFSYDAWKARLQAEDVDWFYTIAKHSIEGQWAASRRDDFPIVLSSPDQFWVLFRCPSSD